ncbi:porin family protein [Lutibacter holmesii]|uniref:Porin family protein n=1 Tax=Lutibacter holmesii TaxID=1137985 RepID=A0ABW3WPL4_9FLAO
MTKKNIITLLLIGFTLQAAQSQVLISLLLGDKLNTEKLKFGLEGGYNLSNITNLESAKAASNFNLGFYFDILLKENTNWYLHTGVIVKSTMGAKIDSYTLDNESLNAVLEDADVRRKINLFSIPINARYKFKNNVFIEAGPMLGWMLKKSHDEFTETDFENEDGELQYQNKIKDNYHTLDLGAQVGIGYQLKAMNNMCLAVKYYHGVIDTKKDNLGDPQYNTSFYVVASIPIGAGEKAKAKNAEAAAKRAAKKAENEKKKLQQKL